jgi:alcohol dehydrogenase class IV
MDMKIRVHRTPKSILTGVDAISRIGAEVSNLRAKKALIMTDPGVVESGMVETVERPLIDAGIEVGVYGKCVPEPPMSSLEEGVRFCEEGHYDCIVGFGGGSAIDVAKITSVLVDSDASVEDMVGVELVPRKGLPVIAVPTTAGTGSEVTAVAIFANEKLNVKQGVSSGFLIPNVAIVDPMLTLSCPAHVTAASGMDALIHNIEAYTSVNATMHTDPLAREGIELISKSIRTAVFDASNIEARAGMAIGALMGGITFGNAGVTAVHALSYPIGGTFHVPHGVANTLMLPWVMEFNMLACLPYFSEIAVAMGENIEGLSVREAAARSVEAMKQLAVDIQVPQYLSDVGIPESAIEDLADGAMTQQRLLVNNPRRLTRDDIIQIYRNGAVRPGSESVAGNGKAKTTTKPKAKAAK